MSRIRDDVTVFSVAAIAAVAGVIARLAPAEPTGRPTIDAVIVAGGVALIVVIGAQAPWWAVVTAAGAALAIALDPLLLVLALAALGAALWVGSTHRTRPDVLALSLGITFNVLVRAELGGPFGVSALITGALAALIVVTGVHSCSKPVRYVTCAVAGGLAAVALIAVGGFGVAAARSRHDLAGGRNAAELGVTAIENGDFGAAERWFRDAAGYLDRAHERLTEPMAAGAALLPVVAQHRDAVVELSESGARGASTVAEALAEIDLDSLHTVDGRIDLDAVAALDGPLTRVREALDDLQQTLDSVRSPWLVHRADIELDDFDESIAEHLPGIDNALTAIRLAPEMLGADGPRRYLVLFTTPSESRGLGGFVGNYAELTVDDGQLSMTHFGRAEDLDLEAQRVGARVMGQEAFLALYGRFGFDTDGTGRVGDSAFRNLAMTPNFPWVGEIAADLYAQTTGREVDGTIAMDPYVVAALLRYSGPIQLTTLDQLLTADSAAPFLLRDQYVLGEADKKQRTDALAEAARLTFEALLNSDLPEPVTLARELGPLASERRMLMWSADPEEQALLEQVHMAGRIPPLDGADGWSFTVSNAAGNKIDSFLQRRARYDSSTDTASDETTATLRVELTNTAPADGLPAYVIGNRIGAPAGTSRLYVSFYSPLALDGAVLDGEATGLTVGREEGWNVYSRFVDIPPGDTVTFELHLRGSVARPDEVVTWEQPMASPLEVLG
jgi:Protein of unknown function (DUF4012)